MLQHTTSRGVRPCSHYRRSDLSKKGRSALFYGWIVAVVAFFTLALVYSIRYSFSFLFVALLDEFGWSRADTAAMFSINVLVYGLALPGVGTLMDRLGPRRVMSAGAILLAIGAASVSLANTLWQFYLLFGVVMALGLCCIGWVPNTTVIANWFEARLGAALGIASAGLGATYVISASTEKLIFSVGWRGAYIILGAVVLLLALPLVALLQRGHPQDMGLLPDGEVKVAPAQVSRGQAMMASPSSPEEWTLGRALRTKALWLFFAASFLLWGIGTTLVITHQVAFTRDIGFSADFGALVYLAFGIAYFISNLGGFISDSIGREKTMTVGVVGAMAGVLMLVLANWYPDARLLFLYSALFGLGAGLCAPVLTAALADFFQGKHFGAINGFVTMSFGVGGAISPWLGGYIYDQLHSYIPAFAIVMVAIAASCVCIWLAEPRKAVEAARRSRLVRVTGGYAEPPRER